MPDTQNYESNKILNITRFISPVFLFVCGLITVPAFLLQQVLLIRIMQVVLFLLLVILSGRKIKPLFHLLLFFSIVFFNTLSPYGEVFFKIGSFPVTLDALKLGILKATTFLGLIYLSQFTISLDLKLPGVIGGIFGKVFYYFEKIKQINKLCTEKNLIIRIDFIMLNILEKPENPEIPDRAYGFSADLSADIVKTNLFSKILLCLFVLLNWGAFVLALVYGMN